MDTTLTSPCKLESLLLRKTYQIESNRSANIYVQAPQAEVYMPPQPMMMPQGQIVVSAQPGYYPPPAQPVVVMNVRAVFGLCVARICHGSNLCKGRRGEKKTV